MTLPGKQHQLPPARRPSATRTVVRVRGRRMEFKPDAVVSEAHLRVTAGDRLLAVLACSPIDLEDLVIGFFFSQGIIDGPQDVDVLDWTAGGDEAGDAGCSVRVGFRDPARAARAEAGFAAARFIPSGCASAPPGRAVPEHGGGGGVTGGEVRAPGGPATPAETCLEPATVGALAAALQQASPLFQATGGAHAAALSGPLRSGSPGLLVVREDIGRHNAVDKVAGHCLRRGVSAADKALLVTGRVSVEIVAKAERLGCPVVVSRSAPTDLAVDLADEAGITLVGFARGDRANVYADWWRLPPDLCGPGRDG